jgi:YHS domain-containing protein
MSEDMQKIPCEVCKKEIPKSVALTAEGMDMIAYFCSVECMNYWKENEEEDK